MMEAGRGGGALPDRKCSGCRLAPNRVSGFLVNSCASVCLGSYQMLLHLHGGVEGWAPVTLGEHLAVAAN